MTSNYQLTILPDVPPPTTPIRPLREETPIENRKVRNQHDVAVNQDNSNLEEPQRSTKADIPPSAARIWPLHLEVPEEVKQAVAVKG